MQELKSCPFCGNTIIYRHQYKNLRESETVYNEIACSSCQAKIVSKYGAEDAVKKWNKRAYIEDTTDNEA